ncbi:hypothetical protein KP003_16655 [Geomonas nitrogeniifigens]|uniref:hypothetical protein n=1 Tax=Geomonas diazotrophica TaxID=2843197 RepID=UPI001C2C8B3C|nr:hypothetical protein [Geomonas nitrogeniifigens]QXE85972.1 hypothetical protein KP003_16655 [Geomonas nitrogeniifigens]
MSLQSILADILDQSVFAGELYYIQAPDAANADDVVKTFGVFTIVGGASFQILEGDTDVSQPRVQVSIYSVDAQDLIAKVAAVNSAMKAASDAGTLKNYSASVPVDGFEQETRRYYSHMDFYCWQEDN